MEKLVFIQVHKLEDEAIKAINKLHAQGFREDQISVLAYNTERFQHLFKPQAVEATLKDEHGGVVPSGEVPKAVEDALAPDVVVPGGVPGVTTDAVFHGAGYVPIAGLAGLNLNDDTLLSHERSLQDGDILVILQTDEGQEYRPDLPLKNK